MQGLNELLLQISKELGVGIEFLKGNFIEELPEIGRYLFIQELVGGLLLGVFVCLLFMVIPFIISFFYYEEKTYHTSIGEDKRLFKKLLKINISIYIILIVLNLMTIIIPYLVSPKFWTIQKLLEMVK
jgi:hypothetical protein